MFVGINSKMVTTSAVGLTHNCGVRIGCSFLKNSSNANEGEEKYMYNLFLLPFLTYKFAIFIKILFIKNLSTIIEMKRGFH